MKKRMCLAAVLLVAGAVYAEQQNIFGPIVPVSAERITFQQVAIPQDQNYYCNAPAYKPVCGVFNDLVALNDPEVDAVLMKHKVQVTDKTGAVAFPRPLKTEK